MEASVSFWSVLVKRSVEDWGNRNGLVVEDRLGLFFPGSFEAKSIEVVEAAAVDDYLSLKLAIDGKAPRDFALFPGGRLMW